MSLSKRKDVSQLVKKYLEDYPNIDRDLLRKLIRLENKIENPSDLRKLDRCLKKAYGNSKPSQNEESTEEIIERIDIRPEWCGKKLSPEYCRKHRLPQFREVKHVVYRKG
jgi:hypothetical protein